MMRRLLASAFTLVLSGFAGIAFAGILLPWKRRVFDTTTPGISTELGYYVFVAMLIIGALLVGRLVNYDEPHALELPILGVATIALITTLAFYHTQIGSLDGTLTHSFAVVEVGRGFFVTLAALIAIEVTVAAHRFEVLSWLWTDTRDVGADT